MSVLTDVREIKALQKPKNGPEPWKGEFEINIDIGIDFEFPLCGQRLSIDFFLANFELFPFSIRIQKCKREEKNDDQESHQTKPSIL